MGYIYTSYERDYRKGTQLKRPSELEHAPNYVSYKYDNFPKKSYYPERERYSDYPEGGRYYTSPPKKYDYCA